MKNLIINTWNGEGYSNADDNKIQVTIGEKSDIIHQLYLQLINADVEINYNKKESSISYTYGEDAGFTKVISKEEVAANIYAIELQPLINTYTLLTKEQYINREIYLLKVVGANEDDDECFYDGDDECSRLIILDWSKEETEISYV